MTGPRDPQAARRMRGTHPAVHATLLTCVAALALYVAQVPAERRDLAELRAHRASAELAWRLEELRAVVADYRHRHGAHPGQAEAGSVPADWFETAYASSRGKHGYEEPLVRAISGVPANPVTGRADVRFLGVNEEWPAEPDELSGWLYRPSTGEVRANCRGFVHGTQRRLYDL